ncbi:MAG: hypothetical protein AAGE89_08500 [Pseudomonadota bacterium]
MKRIMLPMLIIVFLAPTSVSAERHFPDCSKVMAEIEERGEEAFKLNIFIVDFLLCLKTSAELQRLGLDAKVNEWWEKKFKESVRLSQISGSFDDLTVETLAMEQRIKDIEFRLERLRNEK